MNSFQIVAVAIRLLAVGLVVYWVQLFAGTLAYFWTVPESMVPGYSAVSFLVVVFLSALLWKFPGYFASRLLRGLEREEDPQTMTKESILSVGFILLGVLLLYLALSDTVYWIIMWQQMKEMGVSYNAKGIGPANVASVITTVLEFVMALFLLLGGKKLSDLFYRLRYGG